MKRLRFNLRTLLIAVAVVAMFLGYAQWRRQSIFHEAKQLEAMGFTLLWQDTWTNWFWPVIPKDAKVEYYQVSEDSWRFGSRVYALDEVDAHYAQGCDRLRAMGVEEVRFDREGKPGNSGTSTHRSGNATTSDRPAAIFVLLLSLIVAIGAMALIRQIRSRSPSALC